MERFQTRSIPFCICQMVVRARIQIGSSKPRFTTSVCIEEDSKLTNRRPIR